MTGLHLLPSINSLNKRADHFLHFFFLKENFVDLTGDTGVKALWTDTADDTHTKFTPVTYRALLFNKRTKSPISSDFFFRNVTVGHRCHDTKILLEGGSKVLKR